MATLQITDPGQTAALGETLAKLILRHGSTPILMIGPLGSGKTTLTRHIVASLPNAESAQVSSPSFSICNYYPTQPPVAHCDLYRCKSEAPDEIYEALDDPATRVIIEWADYFPKADLPKGHLEIIFNLHNNCRLLEFKAHGEVASAILAELSPGL